MNYLSVIKELKSLSPTVWPKIQHNSALTELALDSLPHDCSVIWLSLEEKIKT